MRGRARRGFSLIELMVVVAIIGLIGAIVTVNVAAQLHKARVGKVRADFHSILQAADLFKTDLGRYPARPEELWEQPASARRWSGPYLREPIALDPWGHGYVYELAAGRPLVICLGADGAPGGEGEGADLRSDDPRE